MQVWDVNVPGKVPKAAPTHVVSPPSPEGQAPQRGGVLVALRRSPLVGAEVLSPRPFEPGRDFVGIPFINPVRPSP